MESSGWAALSGASLVTAAAAIADPASSQFLGELGLTASEARCAPAVARKVLSNQEPLLLAYSSVEASEQMIQLINELVDSCQLRALDALLDVAATLLLSHRDRLQQHLWSSYVFSRIPTLLSLEAPKLSPSGLAVIVQAYAAYGAGFEVATQILAVADKEKVRGGEAVSDALEMLASMVDTRAYLRFARRIRRSLAPGELDLFLTWASKQAKTPMGLPDNSLRPGRLNIGL